METSKEQGDPLDTTVVHLTQADVLTLRDCLSGISIFGSTGSGKTSSSGWLIMLGYLKLGMGGLVLMPKSSDRELWKRACHEADRSDDLIFFNPEGGFRFNFLDYIVKNDPTGATTNATNIFKVLRDLRGRGTGQAQDTFWAENENKLSHYAIDFVYRATGKLELETILDLIMSAPRSEAELTDPVWREKSLFFRFLKKIQATQTELETEDRHDLGHTLRYFLKEFPRIPEKTRMGIISGVSGSFSDLLHSPFRSLFCTSTNITPEDSRNGKIIVLDLPLDEYGETGRLAQCLFKYIWQKSCLQKTGFPVFMWQDEASNFIIPTDETFQSICRSFRIASVYLTQSLGTLQSGLGGTPSAQSLVQSLLANLTTKIFHRQDHPETRAYASELIGRKWQERQSGGTSFGQKSVGFSDGWSQQYDFILPPDVFADLASGGPPFDYQAEAVIYSQGQTFSTRQRYLIVSFDQLLKLKL